MENYEDGNQRFVQDISYLNNLKQLAQLTNLELKDNPLYVHLNLAGSTTLEVRGKSENYNGTLLRININYSTYSKLLLNKSVTTEESPKEIDYLI